MKKLVVVSMLSVMAFWACEKEVVTTESDSQIETNSDEEIVSQKGLGSNCFWLVEYGLYYRGRCYNGFGGICSYKEICIPEIIWDPCQVIPCWIDFEDPWIIYEKINPKDFLSFREELALDIDVKQGVVPFVLNEAVIGLQFYSENEMMSLGEDNILTLKEDLEFDAQTARNLNLKEVKVSAGEYPIIVNKENGTFNVIFAIEKGIK